VSGLLLGYIRRLKSHGSDKSDVELVGKFKLIATTESNSRYIYLAYKSLSKGDMRFDKWLIKNNITMNTDNPNYLLFYNKIGLEKFGAKLNMSLDDLLKIVRHDFYDKEYTFDSKEMAIIHCIFDYFNKDMIENPDKKRYEEPDVNVRTQQYSTMFNMLPFNKLNKEVTDAYLSYLKDEGEIIDLSKYSDVVNANEEKKDL
jgi:hypothetical protein